MNHKLAFTLNHLQCRATRPVKIPEELRGRTGEESRREGGDQQTSPQSSSFCFLEKIKPVNSRKVVQTHWPKPLLVVFWRNIMTVLRKWLPNFEKETFLYCFLISL